MKRTAIKRTGWNRAKTAAGAGARNVKLAPRVGSTAPAWEWPAHDAPLNAPLRDGGRQFPTIKPPRKRRGKSDYASRARDVDRMLWTKTQPCCAQDLVARIFAGSTIDQMRAIVAIGPCDGAVEADHAGRRGMGRKCPDSEVLPLCVRHHRSPGLGHLLYDLSPPRGAMRIARDLLIARQQARYAQLDSTHAASPAT